LIVILTRFCFAQIDSSAVEYYKKNYLAIELSKQPHDSIYIHSSFQENQKTHNFVFKLDKNYIVLSKYWDMEKSYLDNRIIQVYTKNKDSAGFIYEVFSRDTSSLTGINFTIDDIKDGIKYSLDEYSSKTVDYYNNQNVPAKLFDKGNVTVDGLEFNYFTIEANYNNKIMYNRTYYHYYDFKELMITIGGESIKSVNGSKQLLNNINFIDK